MPLPQSPTMTMRALSAMGTTGAFSAKAWRPRKSRTPAASAVLTHSGSVTENLSKSLRPSPRLGGSAGERRIARHRRAAGSAALGSCRGRDLDAGLSRPVGKVIIECSLQIADNRIAAEERPIVERGFASALAEGRRLAARLGVLAARLCSSCSSAARLSLSSMPRLRASGGTLPPRRRSSGGNARYLRICLIWSSTKSLLSS